MRRFAEVEKLDKARITLVDGTVLCGESWGIESAFDADNDEDLGYDVLIFKDRGHINPFEIREEEIVNVEELEEY